MKTEYRESGMQRSGDVSFGTHFCPFCETEQDLLETLALHFEPGPASNELCLWITSDSFETARHALRQVIPGANQHLEAGDIEIISCKEGYCGDEIEAT